MPDKNWKVHERKTAEAFGTKRIGPTGKDGPDFIAWNGLLLAECKERDSLPLWLKNAVQQVQDYVAQSDKGALGIVIFHELGERRRNDLVIIRRDDFIDWFGR